MKWLSDTAIARLRAAADLPDLGGTRYRLVDKLGQGGMGGVYRVEDTALGRQVALKVITVADPGGELATRLLREAHVIARLEHPGIVPVHDVGTLADGRVFYTMKLVQGHRLDQHVLEAARERLRIFQKICEAVSFAHAHGVLHRDLKPENVMVGPFGEVLVMDWGISKVLRERVQPGSTDLDEKGAHLVVAEQASPAGTAHGAVLGTPGYMAPEQARGDVARLDERADVYSLGAMLRFLLRAEPESGSKTTATNAEPSTIPAVWQQGVPRALVAISNKAMREDPADRYATVGDLANDVAHYLDGLPVSAYPEGRLVRLWRWTVKNRAWILLILAYLVMRALLIGWRGR